MAKSKEQKRREAIERARKNVVDVLIPRYTEASTTVNPGSTFPLPLFNRALVYGAYAAHCDRHGNPLDWQYYEKATRATGQNPDPLYLATTHQLLAPEILKGIYHREELRSLYDVAFGV